MKIHLSRIQTDLTIGDTHSYETYIENVFVAGNSFLHRSPPATPRPWPTLTRAFAMAGWRRMIDRYVNRSVMAVCLVVGMFSGYLWTVTTPERLWTLYLACTIAGVSAAGFMQGVFGLLLQIIPASNKMVAITINAVISSLRRFHSESDHHQCVTSHRYNCHK